MNPNLTGRPAKRLKALMLFAVFALMTTPGESRAEEFAIPEETRIIEEEAFAGCTGIRSICLPEGLEEIRSRAFADTALYLAEMPESVENIATDAFSGITTPLLIRTSSGSESMRYAMANRIDFEAGTIRRALLIGQNDYPYPNKLTGPGKDLTKMEAALSDCFEVTVRKNLTASQILTEISSVFSGAKEEDISLFYYSGHGLESDNPADNGSLVGIEFNAYVTAAQLRSALDSIPGRKIVIIDACYSGGMIGRGTRRGENAEVTEESVREAPAVSFMAAFTTPRLRGRSLAAQPYFVMVSSTGSEESWENRDGGYFTGAFTESRRMGDANADGVVTLLESYNYTRNRVNTIMEAEGLEQSVQVYPENCYWFGLFR